MHNVEHIAIVGGGSSAWLTAAYLSKHIAISRITIVDKDDGNTVGVGEATLLSFRPFMKDCGFEFEEWFKELDANYKTGIIFPHWGKNQQTVWHPFAVHLFDDRPPGYLNPAGQNGYNIDCTKLVNYISSKLKNGTNLVKIVKGEVVSLDEQGLLLKNNERIKADLFIDCTGFKSLLQKVPTTTLEDRLICNTAIAGHVPYQDITKEKKTYVISEAVECGWIWTIPLQSRMGSGLVFNRDITPIKEAEKIFKDYWKQRVGTLKVLNWTPYYKKEIWKDNVIRIGLSAGFIEPLESTGIALITKGVEQLVKSLTTTQYYNAHTIKLYNTIMENFFDEAIDFVGEHYTLCERPEPFWQEARKRIKKSERELFYTEQFFKYCKAIKIPPFHYRNEYSFFTEFSWIIWLKQQLTINKENKKLVA